MHIFGLLRGKSLAVVVEKKEMNIFGRFQMFPPAEEEMTWDDSTTPPALRRLTYEDINKELTSATT